MLANFLDFIWIRNEFRLNNFKIAFSWIESIQTNLFSNLGGSGKTSCWKKFFWKFYFPSSLCNEPWCETGIYMPELCSKFRHSNHNDDASKCAYLLTDYASELQKFSFHVHHQKCNIINFIFILSSDPHNFCSNRPDKVIETKSEHDILGV